MEVTMQVKLGQLFDEWDKKSEFSPAERQTAIHFADFAIGRLEHGQWAQPEYVAEQFLPWLSEHDAKLHEYLVKTLASDAICDLAEAVESLLRQYAAAPAEQPQGQPYTFADAMAFLHPDPLPDAPKEIAKDGQDGKLDQPIRTKADAYAAGLADRGEGRCGWVLAGKWGQSRCIREKNHQPTDEHWYAPAVFNDDCIRRDDLPRDVFGLLHDLCYHYDGRDVYGYVRKAQKILSTGGGNMSEMGMICGNRAGKARSFGGDATAGRNFFCENCKQDKPEEEEYTLCDDSRICKECAEKQIEEAATLPAQGQPHYQELAGAMLREEYGDSFNQAQGLDWASCQKMMIRFAEKVAAQPQMDARKFFIQNWALVTDGLYLKPEECEAVIKFAEAFARSRGEEKGNG